MYSTIFTKIILAGACVAALAVAATAQTTEFTYQGNLHSGGSPANGNHDFQIVLFDAVGGGTQLSSIFAFNNVAVTNGSFTIKIDLQNEFPGADRYLEVRVRPSGVGSHITLAPRTRFTSSPYSIKSLNAETAVNALQLGGTAANQFVLTGDARMTDARNPLPGSANYIQNRTTQQSATNFNISGNGTAAVFSASAQYNIGVNRVLSVAGTGNTIVGAGTALGNTGAFNSFFGFNAGFENTSGGGNAFFGARAGSVNTTGFSNSFFGNGAGSVSTGNSNAFFGSLAGNNNAGGSNNTIIGANADVASTNLSFATSIGAGSTVATSNTIALGRSSGADTVIVPGSLTTANVSAPRLQISANSGNILMGDAGCSPGFLGIGFVAAFNACTNHSLLGNGTDTIVNRPAGGRIFFRESNSTQMTLVPGGNLGVGITSPTERLHVNGNSLVTGNSSVGGNLTINGTSSFVGEITAGASATIGGATTIGSSLTVGATANVGALTVGSAANISGPVNTSANYRIGGNQVLTRSRLDLFNTAATPRGYSLEVLNSPSFLVLQNDLGTTIMTVTHDGKIGIGDNNPNEATLEIGGTLAVSNLGGTDGEHLCRDGNVIRACSVAAAKNPGQVESGSTKIAELESTIRRQQIEIELQRNELAALKNFICSQNPAAEVCGPKQ